MQHEEAIRTHAAERYLLDEMSAEERALYEEHYFCCVQCERELSAAAAFVDNARAVLLAEMRAEAAREPLPVRSAEPSGPGWWARLFGSSSPRLAPALGAAAVLLLAIAGYQQFLVIPQLRQELADRDTARAVPGIALRSAARGAGPSLIVDASQPYAVLQADVFSDRPVDTYVASLVDSSGRVQFRTQLAAPEPGLPVTLLVPVRTLAPGEYTLVVNENDQAGAEAGRFTFTLQRQ